MYKLENGEFWCEGIGVIREHFTEIVSDIFYILAELKIYDFIIVLLDESEQYGKRVIRYHGYRMDLQGLLCIDEIIDFGDKMPYEFNSVEELKMDMYEKLLQFIEKF